MEDTATTAADSSPPPEMIAPSPQRGQKRGRGAQDDGEAGDTGAVRGFPRRAAGIYYDAAVEESEEAALFMEEIGENNDEDEDEAFMEEIGENNDEEEVKAAKGLIDFLGVDRNHGDGDAKAGYSSVPDQDPVDAAAAPWPPGSGAVWSPYSAAAPGAAAALDYYEHGGHALSEWELSPSFLLPPPPIHYAVDPAAAYPFYADTAALRSYLDDTAYPSYLDDAAYPLYADVIDGYAGAAAGYGTFAATVFAGDAPNSSPSSGPLGFDLNQQPCSTGVPEEDEADFLVVPDNAAGDASAAAADDATTARPSSSGLNFDLNQPCPSEFPDDGASDDPSDVPPDPAPALAENGLAVAEPDVDEQPELPDGGAPVSPKTPSRRRQPLAGRLWGWAFGLANGLARSRR